ncbi:hypothetical protein GBAR_LOCUS15498 [Geodia barretti]|uniref:Uncharacterized protein n=1 Tax=Geodia barretti TaxID=519541 RepID=A0AA35SCT3_GEOBA|nr:hypothetical protein GBAR_LOCUS15498 [Geodia barretti]
MNHHDGLASKFKPHCPRPPVASFLLLFFSVSSTQPEARIALELEDASSKSQSRCDLQYGTELILHSHCCLSHE